MSKRKIRGGGRASQRRKRTSASMHSVTRGLVAGFFLFLTIMAATANIDGGLSFIERLLGRPISSQNERSSPPAATTSFAETSSPVSENAQSEPDLLLNRKCPNPTPHESITQSQLAVSPLEGTILIRDTDAGSAYKWQLMSRNGIVYEEQTQDVANSGHYPYCIIVKFRSDHILQPGQYIIKATHNGELIYKDVVKITPSHFLITQSIAGYSSEHTKLEITVRNTSSQDIVIKRITIAWRSPGGGVGLGIPLGMQSFAVADTIHVIPGQGNELQGIGSVTNLSDSGFLYTLRGSIFVEEETGRMSISDIQFDTSLIVNKKSVMPFNILIPSTMIATNEQYELFQAIDTKAFEGMIVSVLTDGNEWASSRIAADSLGR